MHMNFKSIRKTVEELLMKNSSTVHVDILYDTYIEFIKEFVRCVDRRFKNVKKWDIETLDVAVDVVSDNLGGSAKVYEIWDEIWDAKIDKRDVRLDIVKIFLDIIDMAERKYGEEPVNK